MPCGLLPLTLDVCPTCGGGYHYSKWPYMIDAAALLEKQRKESPCKSPKKHCKACPLSHVEFKTALLLWIGREFYKTPTDWIREAEMMGISRRVKGIPRGFELGKTWVFAAHVDGFTHPDGSLSPAVFRIFKPTAIEYVVKGTETDEEIDEMVKRGWTPVKVEKEGVTKSLFGEPPTPEEDQRLAMSRDIHRMAKKLKLNLGNEVETMQRQLLTLRQASVMEKDESTREVMLERIALMEKQLGVGKDAEA
jgi:hypothetical protein